MKKVANFINTIDGTWYIKYCDGTQKEIDDLPLEYEEIGESREVPPLGVESRWNFNDGLCPVKINGKWGFVDSFFSVVIYPQFDLVGEIQTWKGACWQPEEYSHLIKWNNGTCKVQIDGKEAVIDERGEILSNYESAIRIADNISFNEIIRIAKENLPTEFRRCPWTYPGLNHGTAVLDSNEQCCAYLAAYGSMHQAKINEVLSKISYNDLLNSDIQIIDWGCGQGLATICLLDFFKANDISLNFVQKVVLIEPSQTASYRAKLHVEAYLKDTTKIGIVEKYIDDVTVEEIESNHPVTIHLFSNILDIPSINLSQLANTIKTNLNGLHYFFCWGPLNYGNTRIDAFWSYFSEANPVFSNVHSKQEYDKEGRLTNTYSYTAKNRVFKVNGGECELILVDYFKPKQFHAAYQLDGVRKALVGIEKEKLQHLYRHLSDFEVQTPFDIGASVYEDVHPILAVLNNIVTRGLPTKASPYIEEVFKVFGNIQEKDNLGGISYRIDELNDEDLFLAMHLVDSRWNVTLDNYNCKVLESELEKTYITEKAPTILRQLLQPQRPLVSISNKSVNYSQRVDFAFEFPYPTKDRNGVDFHGCVVELDGERYHSDIAQQLADKQRDEVLAASNWYLFRFKESEVEKAYKEYNHLGSEYVCNCEKVYRKEFDAEWVKTLQLTLCPIAIARMEKTILEALMTSQLSINTSSWNVLVKEHDVPCAAIAFEELCEMFNRLTRLSADYSNLKFPHVNLTIISTKEFADSPLHLDNKVIVDEYRSNKEYDMVIDTAMLRRSGLEKIDFADYKCKNKCYFNVRSSHYHRSVRKIYTSDRILYKPIAVPNSQGRYDVVEESVGYLHYFLQLIFRKKNFRPGQIPILNRALQYKSVIGLLPTGGGKSLTYQIAAMLQPGITLIIDPLRSLMKDQFDGLINTGIDSCSYINSSIEVPESIKGQGTDAIKKYRREERERRSRRLEKSEIQFMFLSPERLSILDFRERLRNMQDTGVYFAYGVIDEVHCVSEWGHDFRFPYLHLGRNLYKYVLPKLQEENDANNHIPLFGLTATASFDVLADVERELSGNGAFPLDAGTIVREGDTNRLEIQYKIVSIPVTFPCKDGDGSIRQDRCKWSVYDAKKAHLDNLITQLPHYMGELLTDGAIQTIENGYTNGPRADGREITPLQTKIPKDFLVSDVSYDYGGIVFCPHKDNTGIAVFTNQTEIKEKHPDTQIGTFVGSGDDEGDNEQEAKREEESFANLELFRKNKIPLMIATKAFGMGIDKPNVRYTINLNYSSSLESFVQEAGRAGRDQRMALCVIMLSKYQIARVKPESAYYSHFKNKWFNINEISEFSGIAGVPEDDIEVCNESSDLVKLKCKQCGKSCERFERNCCSYRCSKDRCSYRDENCNFECEHLSTCQLAQIPTDDRWNRYEHLEIYKTKYDFITPENYEFLNADYETVMYFYNNNFKGEYLEKKCMHQLLSERNVEVAVGDDKNHITNTLSGFLTTLESVHVGEKIVSYISYNKIEKADISKAIYRMCCIDLIDDFTQDYNNHRFRIVSHKKADGHYYQALENYLRRYYSAERAAELIKEVPNYPTKSDKEIHKCLAFLTHFIYEKVAVKRKRAIDDMFTFCVHGIDDSKDWKDINEELKDELYFYFNSKYARRGYATEKGYGYSLLDDTEEGRTVSKEHLFKYMLVVDNRWIADNSEAGSTQIDNAKHLYGAVRLIRRYVPEDNPVINLLGAFCLMFLGTNNNPLLQRELENLYVDGMAKFRDKTERKEFWKDIFTDFNKNDYVTAYFNKNGDTLKSLVQLEIHKKELANIKNKYTI